MWRVFVNQRSRKFLAIPATVKSLRVFPAVTMKEYTKWKAWFQGCMNELTDRETQPCPVSRRVTLMPKNTALWLCVTLRHREDYWNLFQGLKTWFSLFLESGFSYIVLKTSNTWNCPTNKDVSMYIFFWRGYR